MKSSISATKFYSALRGNTCIYLSLYLAEKFIPNTIFDVRSPKENGDVREHKEEQIKGLLMSNYPDS